MDKLFGMLQTVVPVLLMIMLGIFCKKKKIISKHGIAGFKSFVFYITLPFVVFKAFYNATYSVDVIVITVAMFLACVIALLMGSVFKRITKSTKSTSRLLITGFESGMLGYALYTLLFGIEKVSYFATVDLGQELFIFIIFMTLLLPPDPKLSGVKGTLKRMATTPLIIAVFIGIIVGVTGLGNIIYTSAAGESVQYILDFVSAPTSAVILFVVGYELELKNLDFKAVLSVVLTRVVIVGVICVAFLTVLSAIIEINEYYRWAIILLFILPPPFIIPILLNDEKENAYVSACLSTYTILTLIAFAFISYSIA